MAASRQSVRAVGFLLSAAVVAVSGLLVIKPVYDDISESQAELSSLQETTKTKEGQLEVLEGGVSNYDDIQAYVDNFLSKVSATKDIESASRSISSAAIPGVNIVSFTFGSEENIEEYEVPAPTLSDYTPPVGFSGDAAAAPDTEGTEAPTVDTFHRVPVEISVTANSYDSLATYLDNLANQNRLMTVVSVTSTRTVSEESTTVTATIYAYTFVYAR